MSDTMKCPECKWICITLCSQGADGGRCPHDSDQAPLPKPPPEWFGEGGESAAADSGHQPGEYAGRLAKGDSLIIEETPGESTFVQVIGAHAPGYYVCETIKPKHVDVAIRHRHHNLFSLYNRLSKKDYARLFESAKHMCYCQIIH